MAYKGTNQYMEQDFTDYILSLKPYSLFLGVCLQPYYFEKFVSDVRLENARNIIEKQWDNKDKMNRWNPPGKTYLYLSFDKNERKYNDELQEQRKL